MCVSLVRCCFRSRPAVDAFKDDLTEYLKDHPAELTRGVPEMIEILPPGASKAAGLEALLKEMNIRPDEVGTARVTPPPPPKN